MKFLEVATIFLAVSIASGLEFHPRITGGYSASSNLVRCYVALQIDTENYGQKFCGGCLLSQMNAVVTSASCVFSAQEGKANAIKFFTGLSGQAGTPSSQFVVDDILKPAGFDASKNTSVDDVAIIRLKNRISTTSFVMGAVPATEEKVDAYIGQQLVVCGHGFIDNNRTRPGSRGLQCTTLRVIPAADCFGLLPTVAPVAPAAGSPPAPAPVAPTSMICARNNDDRNVCGGDQGSPVFSNQTGSLQLVGVVSYYPDARANARCKDGHAVVITQLANYRDFISTSATPSSSGK